LQLTSFVTTKHRNGHRSDFIMYIWVHEMIEVKFKTVSMSIFKEVRYMLNSTTPNFQFYL